MHTVFLLAKRYAFSSENRHKGTSIRIASGLALCLFAITMVLSFMQALQKNQFEDIRTFESYDLQIALDSNDLQAGYELVDRLETLAEVDHAFLYAEIPTLIQTPEGSTLAGRIRAIDPKGIFEDKVNSYRGTLYTPGTLSSSYLHTKDLNLGSQVNVTILKKGRQATVIPSQKEMTIGSIYYTSMYDFDSSTFLTDLPTLYALNGDVPLFMGIFSSFESEETKQAIKLMEPKLEISTWKEVNASLYGAMQLEQSMMTLMLFLMVLVVIIHIRNSSRRLLLAKQREIAMLRSMGLRRNQVQSLFIYQAVLVAVVGCTAGVLLSYLGITVYPSFSDFVYSSMGVHLKLTIKPLELVALVASILIFSSFAAYVGTRRILKADIMEMFAHDEVK